MNDTAYTQHVVYSSPRLNPCPFCTKQVILVSDSDGYTFIECLWCHARGPRIKTTESAAAARTLRVWQSRTHPRA